MIRKWGWLAGVLGALAIATSTMSFSGCVVRGRATWVVESEPPPPQQEVEPAPRAGHVWVKGHWEYRQNRWMWSPGYWEAQRVNYVWIEGRWEQRGRQWHWVPGRWEAQGTVSGDVGGGEPGPRFPRHRTVDSGTPTPVPVDDTPPGHPGHPHEHAHQHPHDLGDHHHHPHAHPHPNAETHHHPY